jgi:hypothetical protein
MSVLALLQSNDAAWTGPTIHANDVMSIAPTACMNGKSRMLGVSL